MKTKRFAKCIALCLTLLQLLLLCAACGGEENVTTGPATTGKPSATTQKVTTTETPTTERPTTERPTTEEVTTPEPLPEEVFLTLAADGEALYTIVRPANASPAAVEKILEFASDLEIVTGATFRVVDDSTVPESEQEILIGAFDNREGASEITVGITYTESRVEVMEERIVIAPYEGHLDWIFGNFIDVMFEDEDGNWVISTDELFYSRSMNAGGDIPVYETVAGQRMGDGLYFGTRNGYTVGITETNLEEFEAYVAKLEGLGYKKYAENEIGKIKFFTYTAGATTLHVQYITADAKPAVKVSMTRGEFLPPKEAEPYTNRVDSNIVSLKRLNETGHGGSSGLWGLNMIFQLADGSFVIVDGSLYTPGHEAMLYEYLMANKPDEHERPIISCWLWTHGHGDHVDMCKNMISRYSDKIDVLTFAYNYPNWDALPEKANPGNYFGDGLVADTKKYYPDANHWVMHAGQKLYVADAVIECIWTHEDSYPGIPGSVNGTDSVFRITIDGIVCTMLGDCEDPHNSKMVACYGDELRSHVVQNAHHTLNGPKSMYECIDPIISYWANTDESLGYSYAHAQFLKYTRWTRTDANGQTVTGERQHYTHSYNSTLYIKDIKATYGHLH